MQILIAINTIYQMKATEGITESLNSGNQKEWGRLNFEAPVCKIKCRRSFFRKINRRK